MPPGVCVESEILSLAYAHADFISKIFTPFPLFSLLIIAKHNLNSQQTAKHPS